MSSGTTLITVHVVAAIAVWLAAVDLDGATLSPGPRPIEPIVVAPSPPPPEPAAVLFEPSHLIDRHQSDARIVITWTAAGLALFCAPASQGLGVTCAVRF